MKGEGEGLRRRDFLRGARNVAAGAAAAGAMAAAGLGATAAEAAEKVTKDGIELYPGHEKDIQNLQTLRDKLKAPQNPAERRRLELEARDQIAKMNEKIKRLGKTPQ